MIVDDISIVLNHDDNLINNDNDDSNTSNQ